MSSAPEEAESGEAAAVTINDHLMSHGTPGFEDMTQPKVVNHDTLAGATGNIWWYPHSSEVLKGLSGARSTLRAVNNVGFSVQMGAAKPL